MMADDTSCLDNDRHILIAVDGSENSKRAVIYVGKILGSIARFHATLLAVIPEPPIDYFKTLEERTAWIEKHKSETAAMLDEFRQILIRSGFEEDKVESITDVSFCPAVADCILKAQQRLKSGTLVVGRRGISKKEEFLFGSTSSKIVHSARNCAVWVIE